jgi:hypothetical protein
MVQIKSQVFSFATPLEKVAAYLENCSNYSHLLPQNQISDFMATEQGFSFKAAGNFMLGLEKQQSNEQGIKFIGVQKNPFPFDLQIHLQAINAQTTGFIEINADVNMMMRMLLEKPLQKLLQDMAINLETALQA